MYLDLLVKRNELQCLLNWDPEVVKKLFHTFCSPFKIPYPCRLCSHHSLSLREKGWWFSSHTTHLIPWAKCGTETLKWVRGWLTLS